MMFVSLYLYLNFITIRFLILFSSVIFKLDFIITLLLSYLLIKHYYNFTALAKNIPVSVYSPLLEYPLQLKFVFSISIF